MADTRHEVETELRVNDEQATRALGRISGAVGRVSGMFDKASNVLGIFGGVAGGAAAVFGAKEMLSGTMQYLETVKRISSFTGVTYQQADGLSQAFAKSGIEAGETERMLFLMSRRTQQMQMHADRFGMRMGGNADLAKRLGVNFNKGPVEAMTQLAAAAEKGKVNAVQLSQIMGIRPAMALKMMEVLEKGPAAIKKAVAAGQISERDIKNFDRVQNAQHVIAASWKRIQVLVGKELLPVVGDLMEKVAANMEKWVDKAAEFGKTLGRFLTQHGPALLKLGKLMLLNFTLMRTVGIGFGGMAGRALGFATRGSVTGGISGALGSAGGMFGRVAGAIAGGPSTWIPIIARIGGMLGRFTLVGAIVLFIVKAFEAIKDNALGVRDYLVGLWTSLKTRFAAMAIALAPVLQAFSSDGVIGKFFTQVVVGVIKGLGSVVDSIMTTIHIIINAVRIVAEEGFGALTDPVKLFKMATAEANNQMLQAARLQKQQDAADAAAAAGTDTPKQRAGAPYNDFRGSRFDIKQAFAEGFDPDRVAVAFTNDLAKISERRTMSGYSQPFASR